jgi:nucleoprotein TPR
LEGKTAELELSVKVLTTQKEAATVSATKATMDCSKLTMQVQQLSKELKTTEKDLKAAKIKLGDVTIDTSAEEALEAKVTSPMKKPCPALVSSCNHFCVVYLSTPCTQSQQQQQH